MTFNQLGELSVLTLRDPERGLRALQGLQLTMPARWMVLLLAVSLSTLLAGLSRAIFPLPAEYPLADVINSPVTLAALQFAAMTVSAALMSGVGRIFGGQGSFPDALLVTAWIEMVLVGVQATQLVLMILMPGAAGLLSLVAIGLFFYLTVTMTKALHGFENTLLVILGIIGTAMTLGLVLAIFGVTFGIMPEIPTNDL